MDRQLNMAKQPPNYCAEQSRTDLYINKIINRTDDEWIQVLANDRITCSQAIKERTAVLARKDNVMPKLQRDFIAEEINILGQYRSLLNERIIHYLKNT